MTIREVVPNFRFRDSDVPIVGRNKTRIVLGTDRKNTIDSGFGDGSRNASEGAGAIDLVVGYNTDNSDFINDKARIYLASKTNPDEYTEINVGDEQKETSAAIVIADQVYLKARKTIKIVNGNISIVLFPNGNIEIRATGDTKIKSGNSVISMGAGGQINIGSEGGQTHRIVTEDSVAIAIDPVTGAFVPCRFIVPGAIGTDHPGGATIPNNNVKITK